MTFTRRVSQILPLALLTAVALVPVGCSGKDGVNSYDVVKPTDTGKKDGGGAGGDYRLLGLMVPADNPIWFFKYNGPTDVVTKYEGDFDKLAASIRSNGESLPLFAPPDGWEQGPGRQFVAGTIKTKDGKQEISISNSQGGIEQNLGRWVGQIGLKPSPEDAAKYTKVIDGSGVKVRRVDLRGPNDPTTKRGNMPGMPAGHP